MNRTIKVQGRKSIEHFLIHYLTEHIVRGVGVCNNYFRYSSIFMYLFLCIERKLDFLLLLFFIIIIRLVFCLNFSNISFNCTRMCKFPEWHKTSICSINEPCISFNGLCLPSICHLTKVNNYFSLWINRPNFFVCSLLYSRFFFYTTGGPGTFAVHSPCLTVSNTKPPIILFYSFK